jgi:hypothetical protein
VRMSRLHTRMPTLMTAYTYAKLRAIGSLDALKSATASVPIRTDILRYDTHAGIKEKSSAKGSVIALTANSKQNQKKKNQRERKKY